jgi:hypothetical protein
MEAFNRIEAEMKVWRNREERFEKLFPDTLQTNRAFLAEKLNYLQRTQIKFGRANSEDERLALKILRQERKQLERVLYPKFINRALRGILRTMILLRDNNRQQQRAVSDNRALMAEVSRIGFGTISQVLQQKIAQGARNFAIPYSQYVNGKEIMDFKIDVAGNGPDGYKIQGIHAVLKQGGKSEAKNCHFNFEQSVAFDAKQAYNLLKGRAVQTELLNPDGKKETVWRQLDFNDKDATGNYRMKDFPLTYGYSLENALLKLPLMDNNQLSLKEDILKALKNGDLVEIKLKHEGKGKQFFLEADPRQKSLGVYNAEMKKVNLSMFDAKSSKVQANTINLTKVKKLDIVPAIQIRRSRSRGIN